jgi:hypothetical protein
MRPSERRADRADIPARGVTDRRAVSAPRSLPSQAASSTQLRGSLLVDCRSGMGPRAGCRTALLSSKGAAGRRRCASGGRLPSSADAGGATGGRRGQQAAGAVEIAAARVLLLAGQLLASAGRLTTRPRAGGLWSCDRARRPSHRQARAGRRAALDAARDARAARPRDHLGAALRLGHPGRNRARASARRGARDLGRWREPAVGAGAALRRVA